MIVSRFSLPKGNEAKAQATIKAMETHESNIHIGNLIREQLRKDQRSVSWLSREIHCSRNHLYKVFRKPSLDADLLLRISKSVQFNFFQYYTAEFLESLRERTGEETAQR